MGELRSKGGVAIFDETRLRVLAKIIVKWKDRSEAECLAT